MAHSADIKLSKTHLHKIGQSGGFLFRFLGTLLKAGLPLMKTVLKPLAKIILISLGLTAAASATDSTIYKKVFGSGRNSLIILNEEMNDIIKTIKSLEESGLLIKGVCETIKNEAEEQKAGFLRMLFGTLGASLLGNLLRSKGVMRAVEGTGRADQNF